MEFFSCDRCRATIFLNEADFISHYHSKHNETPSEDLLFRKSVNKKEELKHIKSDNKELKEIMALFNSVKDEFERSSEEDWLNSLEQQVQLLRNEPQ